MVKSKDTVIDEFNSLVNMTPNELRDWLKGTQSQSSGWTNESSSSGETIGHERHVSHLLLHYYYHNISYPILCGRKIVSILEHNPSKDPSGYSDEDVDHMRKVVSYCKRHLAQEETAKQNTDSKSYKSLKNWGHDPLKG
ncbi:hypothetical protein RIB2604_02604050 [Aspergillus luchuensis]|uniref:Uncharacterized protein n=1 Tax=Aspergillus kawachii TaxID=1069201 RepID=A0A146FSK3_ASPKA|nr:hypothetical protein AKAW_01218 [Aspergillus luchuensis IFO 4308]GAT28760.1 hypothetical protein RIB2604_02604050 [Aspergillus luchuensis]